MSEPPVPTVVAVVLCDRIITEAQTNKKTLVGTFDTLWAQQPPFLAPVWLYIRLTDAEGKYRFKVKLVYLDADTPIMEAETAEVTAADRLAYGELVIPIPAIPLQKEGTYEFQIFANDVYIGRTTMLAKLLK